MLYVDKVPASKSVRSYFDVYSMLIIVWSYYFNMNS